MKVACKICLFLLMIFLIVGCAHKSDNQEIDADAFVRFFSAQSKCRAYIDALVEPVVVNLSAITTPEEMRVWIAEQPAGDFSDLVAGVQAATVRRGPIDPVNESDQLEVSRKLSLVLSQRSDYTIACDATAPMELLADLLYLRLGGNESRFAEEFRRRGIADSWDQKWILTTTLLAGSLK